MRTALLVTAAALTLAGCGGSGGTNATSSTTTTSSSSVTPGGTTEAKTESTTTTSSGMPSAASLGIRPGKWENRVEILDMKVEGMPPQMAAAMQKGIADRKPQIGTSCLSAEEAAKGPAAAMLDKMHCSFTKSDTAGGHIATEMVCNMPNGKLTASGDGVYTPTSYSVDGHGSMTGRMGMSMHTRTTGKWLGECDGTESNATGKK